MHVEACFRVSLLDFQEEQQEQQAKRVADGHGRSFGPRPWQQQFLFCQLFLRYIFTCITRTKFQCILTPLHYTTLHPHTVHYALHCIVVYNILCLIIFISKNM